MNYKDSGVDIEKGDLFIERIKPFIKETYHKEVKAGVGGFAALYKQGDRYLAAGTDGVGTKLKLAIELGIHDTIGQDLVAMCVNDILCTGARPLFFLDYLATSSLDLEVHSQVVKGIANACAESGCALIGGETAEMPGMYLNGDYDLAGFVVGDVAKENLIDGSKVEAGMNIYALPSSGFHSNGFSLVRKLIREDELDLKRACLTPTKLYVKRVQELTKKYQIAGLAHITGGGLHNITRISDKVGFKITSLPTMPNFMQEVIERANLLKEEQIATFNMGIGFVFVSSETIDEHDITLVGTTTNQSGLLVSF